MVKRVYGQPIWFAHRVDLHESLKNMAFGGNGRGTVEIKKGCEVIGYVRAFFSSPSLLERTKSSLIDTLRTVKQAQ